MMKIGMVYILLLLSHIGIAQDVNKNQVVGCTNNSSEHKEPFWTKRTYVMLYNSNEIIYSDFHFKSLDVLYKEEEERRDKNEIDSSALFLITTLDSCSLKNRIKTIQLLGYIEDTIQIPILENLLLNDSSLVIRVNSAKSLKILHSISSIPYLIEALSDLSSAVVLESALCLAELGEKEYCLEAFIGVWNANLGNRSRCHTGLRDIGNKKSVDFLKSAAKDSIVGLDACVVLAQLGYLDFAKEKILLRISDPNASVRLIVLYISYKYLDVSTTVKIALQLQNDIDEKVSCYAKSILLNLK